MQTYIYFCIMYGALMPRSTQNYNVAPGKQPNLNWEKLYLHYLRARQLQFSKCKLLQCCVIFSPSTFGVQWAAAGSTDTLRPCHSRAKPLGGDFTQPTAQSSLPKWAEPVMRPPRTCQQHAGSVFQRNRNRRAGDWQAAERAGKPRDVAQHRLVSVARGRRPFNARAGRSSPRLPLHCGTTTRRENGRRGHVAAWFSRDHT